MMLKKIVLSAAVVGTVLAGSVAVDTVAAPESSAAAACWGQITQSKGKNYTGCGAARHFNAIGKNLSIRWGSRAGANQWSYESACWSDIRKYGMARSA